MSAQLSRLVGRCAAPATQHGRGPLLVSSAFASSLQSTHAHRPSPHLTQDALKAQPQQQQTQTPPPASHLSSRLLAAAVLALGWLLPSAAWAGPGQSEGAYHSNASPGPGPSSGLPPTQQQQGSLAQGSTPQRQATFLEQLQAGLLRNSPAHLLHLTASSQAASNLGGYTPWCNNAAARYFRGVNGPSDADLRADGAKRQLFMDPEDPKLYDIDPQNLQLIADAFKLRPIATQRAYAPKQIAFSAFCDRLGVGNRVGSVIAYKYMNELVETQTRMTWTTLMAHLKAVRNLQKMQCTLRMVGHTGAIYGEQASIRSDQAVKLLCNVFKMKELEKAHKTYADRGGQCTEGYSQKQALDALALEWKKNCHPDCDNPCSNGNYARCLRAQIKHGGGGSGAGSRSPGWAFNSFPAPPAGPPLPCPGASPDAPPARADSATPPHGRGGASGGPPGRAFNGSPAPPPGPPLPFSGASPSAPPARADSAAPPQGGGSGGGSRLPGWAFNGSPAPPAGQPLQPHLALADVMTAFPFATEEQKNILAFLVQQQRQHPSHHLSEQHQQQQQQQRQPQQQQQTAVEKRLLSPFQLHQQRLQQQQTAREQQQEEHARPLDWDSEDDDVDLFFGSSIMLPRQREAVVNATQAAVAEPAKASRRSHGTAGKAKKPAAASSGGGASAPRKRAATDHPVPTSTGLPRSSPARRRLSGGGQARPGPTAPPMPTPGALPTELASSAPPRLAGMPTLPSGALPTEPLGSSQPPLATGMPRAAGPQAPLALPLVAAFEFGAALGWTVADYMEEYNNHIFPLDTQSPTWRAAKTVGPALAARLRGIYSSRKKVWNAVKALVGPGCTEEQACAQLQESLSDTTLTDFMKKKVPVVGQSLIDNDA